MPAYNAATTIAQAIGSIVAQTDPNWELIVVNDGSTDRTGKIAAAFVAGDSRIRLINRPNGGESAARNTGVAEAHYEWLAFLDADDWVLPAYIERLMAALTADPTLDAAHCGWARVAKDGTQVIEDYRPPTGDLFPVLARQAAFPVNACIVRKSLLDTVGAFDTTLIKSPDWDLWQRIARAGAKFGGIPDILACYRMRPSSASLDAEQMLRDGLTVLKRGHGPDARVPDPIPEYASGLPGSTVESQEFYLLSWSAGLLLGSGRDARPLLELVGDGAYPGLYANAVAQCIFEAATLPSCRPWQAWEFLWPRVKELAETFLVALEAQSQSAGLARGALTELKRLVLKHTLTWAPVIEQDEKTIAELRDTIAQFVEGSRCLEADRDQWRQRSEAVGQEKASAESDLAESRHFCETLSAENSALSSALSEMGSRIDELEGLRKEKAFLSGELELWRRAATDRELLIEEIQHESWVRTGMFLRIMRRRQMMPGILELTPRSQVSDAHSVDAGGARRNWEIRIAPGNEAKLICGVTDPELVRVEITKVGTRNPWDIQLNLAGLSISSGQRYAVVFRARGERFRRIGVGFAKAYEPWSNLGLYVRVQLTHDWQTFYEEFVAVADDDNARIHFDLGGRRIGVDLTSVVLQRVDNAAGKESPGSAESAEQNGRLV
jgi:hypothetical protein